MKNRFKTFRSSELEVMLNALTMYNYSQIDGSSADMCVRLLINEIREERLKRR